MAYATIPTDIIEAGDPVTQVLMNTFIKNNFDDHEARLIALEGGSAVAYVPFFWHVNGFYGTNVPVTNAGVIRLPFNIQVLGARVLAIVAGSSGSTEVDFLFKRGAAAYVSLVSTRPSVASAAGDNAVSTNVVISTSALETSDLLRMDITAAQGGEPKAIVGIIEFQKT